MSQEPGHISAGSSTESLTSLQFKCWSGCILTRERLDGEKTRFQSPCSCWQVSLPCALGCGTLPLQGKREGVSLTSLTQSGSPEHTVVNS